MQWRLLLVCDTMRRSPTHLRWTGAGATFRLLGLFASNLGNQQGIHFRQSHTNNFWHKQQGSP